MAYYPVTMNQVKQIYKLRSEGVGIKRIAAILGISKNTVKSYLRKMQELDRIHPANYVKDSCVAVDLLCR